MSSQISNKRGYEPATHTSDTHVSAPKRRRLDPEQAETVGTLVGRKIDTIQKTCSSAGTYFPPEIAQLVMSHLFNEEQFRSLYMITQDPLYATFESNNRTSTTNDAKNALFARTLADFVAPGSFSTEALSTNRSYKVLVSTYGTALRALTDELLTNNSLPCKVISQTETNLRSFELPTRLQNDPSIGFRRVEDWVERGLVRYGSRLARQTALPVVHTTSTITIMSNKTVGEIYPLINRTDGRKGLFTYFNDNLSTTSFEALPVIKGSNGGYFPIQSPWNGTSQRGGWPIEPEVSLASSSSSSSQPALQSPLIQERVLNQLNLDLVETEPTGESKLCQLSIKQAGMLQLRILAIKDCSEIESEVELYHLVEAIQIRLDELS